MQVTPSPRIPARRPGLWSTTQRFTAGQEHRFGMVTDITYAIAVVINRSVRFPRPFGERVRVRGNATSYIFPEAASQD